MLVLALFASAASASYHTFVVDELYSSADGNVQYVVLREAEGAEAPEPPEQAPPAECCLVCHGILPSAL